MSTSYTSTRFMTAADKGRVAKQWERFLESNMARDKFGAKLYDHLHLHCGHIAHYDRDGFYAEWFAAPGKRIEFIQRWADDYQTGRLSWGANSDYDDLNAAMYKTLTQHADRIAILAQRAVAENLREDIVRKQAMLDRLEGRS